MIEAIRIDFPYSQGNSTWIILWVQTFISCSGSNSTCWFDDFLMKYQSYKNFCQMNISRAFTTQIFSIFVFNVDSSCCCFSSYSMSFKISILDFSSIENLGLRLIFQILVFSSPHISFVKHEQSLISCLISW